MKIKLFVKKVCNLFLATLQLRQSKKQDSTWCGHFANKNRPFYKVLYIADNYPSKFHIVWDSSRSNEPNDGNGLLREMIVIIERVQWTV